MTYSDELRRIISKPEKGVILDAELLQDPQTGEAVSYPGAVFQLTSGRHQKRFVTLWQLFDEPEFERCLDMLAGRVRTIRRMRPFTAVVSCTVTARHIMDCLHARIETGVETVQVHYFGSFPFVNDEIGSYPDLRGQRVLILNDVIATGSLVRQMTRTIRELGGRVVGALAIVLTGRSLIAAEGDTEEPSTQMEIDGRALTIDYLTSYFIDDEQVPIEPSTPQGQTIWRIDPTTVFPKGPEPIARDYVPVFDQQTMFRHFEEANAIDVGFFETDERRTLAAIRIRSLLDRFGNDIWRALKPSLGNPNDYTIVATYDDDDMAFKRFVANRLREDHSPDVPFAMVCRRENGGGSNKFFLLPANIAALRSRGRIVLLLASSHTSETLRELVASVANSAHPHELTVISLLNRMGGWTYEFVTRIKQILSGTAHNATKETRFSYIPLYNLPEFNRNDIVNMQRTVVKLLNDYKRSEPTALLHAFIEQDKKHFQYRTTTSYGFVHPSGDMPLRSKYTLALQGTDVSVASVRGKQLLICCHVASTRDYGPVLRELRREKSKDALYLYFAILLGDINYLKLTNQHRKACDVIKLRVLSLMERRLRAEREGRLAQGLPDEVLLEANLAFGLALLAYRDVDSDHSEFLKARVEGRAGELVHQGLPTNFSRYFGSERWLLSTSMLLYFLRFATGSATRRTTNTSIVDLLRPLLDDVDRARQALNVEAGEEELAARKAVLNDARTNINALIREIGGAKSRTKEQVIRFLHSQIIATQSGHDPRKSSHNPISTNLRLAEASILYALEFATRHVTDLNPEARVNLIEVDTAKVEAAMASAHMLQEIAYAMTEMCDFSQMHGDVAQRFLAKPDEPGFPSNVRELVDLLFQVRRNKALSRREVDRLGQLRKAVRDEVLASTEVRTMLKSFVRPARRTVAEMMEEANIELSHTNDRSRWPHDIIDRVRSVDDEVYVLMEHDLLQEVLKNLCTNVRYQESDGKPADLDCDITVLDAPPQWAMDPSMQYVRIDITSLGKDFVDFGSESRQLTIVRHQRDVLEFGGKLEVSRLEGERQGAVASLTLINRPKPEDELLGNETDRTDSTEA